MTIANVKNHLIGMSHSGTLNKVRNFEDLLLRAANIVNTHLDPIETQRLAPLSQVVHDDVNNYSLPSDFKKPIDLYPQDDREKYDSATRKTIEKFDLLKKIRNKEISIESNEGTKFIRINWKSRASRVIHNMNSRTANGTWSAVGSATGIVADDLYKVSGSASIRFNVVASGDGIQNTTMSAVDLSEWDEQADFFAWVYLSSVTNLTSIRTRWGNDLTTNYWESVAQTAQADGTAFRTGWNLIRFPWTTAVEAGTVAPATIDSFRIIFNTTGAIDDVRVDNIIASLGRPFDIKYYSKFAFRNSAGTWIEKTTSDSDEVVYEGTSLQIFLLESLKAMAQQVQGEDSVFDIQYADKELGDPTNPRRTGLYHKYRSEYPSQSKKTINSWFSIPRFRRI